MMSYRPDGVHADGYFWPWDRAETVRLVGGRTFRAVITIRKDMVGLPMSTMELIRSHHVGKILMVDMTESGSSADTLLPEDFAHRVLPPDSGSRPTPLANRGH